MMNNYVNVTPYEDFVPESEIYQFECDMEEGEYHDWIDEYPEHILSIFGSFLEFGSSFVTEADIVYFINQGLDLNVVSNAYVCEDGYTTPLIYACENRNPYLIEYLIRNGADPNKKVKDTSPLESIIIGHGMLDLEKIEEAEKCIKLLLELGTQNEIRKSVIEDYCEYYFENSSYIRNILNDAKIL